MKNSRNPKLSIVINHHRTPNILMMCLDAIKKEIKDVNHEIIVTDSETEEMTVNLLRQNHPDVLFIGNEKNVGFSKIVNPALEKSEGKFILSINADIIVKDGRDILKMIDYLEKNPDVGVVGPKLENPDGSIQQSYFREYTLPTIIARRMLFGKTALGKKLVNKFIYKDKKYDLARPLEVEWLMGSALLAEKSRLDKIGGRFDDRFFMYFEDVDLCRRFREAGFKVVYFPQARLTHYHIRASHGGKGIFDVFQNWLTRVHIVSYFKYLWKWRVEKIFQKSVK